MESLSEVVPFCMERIGLERFNLVCVYIASINGSGNALIPSVNGLLVSWARLSHRERECLLLSLVPNTHEFVDMLMA